MTNHKNKAYSENNFCYVTPLLELLSVESSGILCESGGNDDFIDNTDPVDWFDE